jgi:hypothetical protein
MEWRIVAEYARAGHRPVEGDAQDQDAGANHGPLGRKAADDFGAAYRPTFVVLGLEALPWRGDRQFLDGFGRYDDEFGYAGAGIGRC